MIELTKGEARLCYKTLVGEVNAELDADIIKVMESHGYYLWELGFDMRTDIRDLVFSLERWKR
jgi:hypothetical protein